MVRGVWVVMALAAQVHSRLGALEALNWTRSSVHRCNYAMPMRKWGRSRTARYELPEMVPNTDSAALLVRGCSELPCTLRGSDPTHGSVGTCAASADTTDLLPDAVVFVGEALHSDTAVGEMVSPSWPRDRVADAADVSIAAATMGAAVVDDAVGAVAVLDESVVDGPAAGCDLYPRRGAWRSVCRGGPGHGLRLWPQRYRRPHGQRQARGSRHSSSLGPTESSPPSNSTLQVV